MDPEMIALITKLLTPEVAAIGAIAWVALVTVGRVLPGLFQQPLVARLAPLLPLVVTSVLVWVPGLAPPGLAPAERVLAGAVLGYLVAHNHKMLLQTVLGADARIPQKDTPLARLAGVVLSLLGKGSKAPPK